MPSTTTTTSSSSLLHRVSISDFFTDGFTLVSSSSSSSSCLHFSLLGDNCKQITENEETNTTLVNNNNNNNNIADRITSDASPFPRLGLSEHIAGIKRLRSSLSEASLEGITPSSEDQADSYVNNNNNNNENNNNSNEDDLLLLKPSANSLLHLGPSGAWSKSPIPIAPEEFRTNINIENVKMKSPLNISNVESENFSELSTLLQIALRECYHTEDELIRKQQEEKEEEIIIEKEKQEEEFIGVIPRYSSIASSPSVNFEKIVQQIHSQKQKQRQHSQKIESQTRDIARSKELPLLIEDSIRYAQLLVEWSGKSEGHNYMHHREENNVNISEEVNASEDNNSLLNTTESNNVGSTGIDFREHNQMLYAKFPPPLFQNSSFAAGVGRLLRWVRTWQRASPVEVGISESFPKEEEKVKRSKNNNINNNKTPKKDVLNLKQQVSNASRGRGRGRGRPRKQIKISRSNSTSSNTSNKSSKSSINSESTEKKNENLPRFSNNVENKKNEEIQIPKRTTLQRYHDDWIRMADRMLNTTISGTNNNNNNENGLLNSNISAGDSSPTELREEIEFGLDNDHIIYDEYGNRLRSVRLAKKMAEKRALQEEAEKARAQRRGYFARVNNDNNNNQNNIYNNNTRTTRRTLFDNDSGSDSNNSSNDINNQDITNIAVLHGPCGVGKTAIVYLVAEILGYRVVEMNTSVRRCPKNIDRLLSEVTRSKRLSGLANTKSFVCIETELKKLKSEHAAMIASSSFNSSSPSSGVNLVGNRVRTPNQKRKSNVISASAVADFFKPRCKSNIILPDVVDVDTSSPIKSKKENISSSDCESDVQVITTPDFSKNIIKNINNTLEKISLSEGVPTPITNNNNNNNNNNNATTTGIINGNSEDDSRTLLLFEDADVILGDEVMKSFYASVRDLAQRSKVPIVVTVSSPPSNNNNYNYNYNSFNNGRLTALTQSSTSSSMINETDNAHIVSMGSGQVAHFFGKQTPFTGIHAMSRTSLFIQLLIVAAVERGLLSLIPGLGSNDLGKTKQEISGVNEIISSPLFLLSSRDLVIVNNVTEFKRIADAIRKEVYNISGKESLSSLSESNNNNNNNIKDYTDIRLWLNRLQYLLLQEQWPNSGENSHETNIKNSNILLSQNIKEEEKEEKENVTGDILPTKNIKNINIMNRAVVRSRWDARMGRVLHYSSSVNNSLKNHFITPWEWQQFQYMEEISNFAIGNINGNSSCSSLLLLTSNNGGLMNETRILNNSSNSTTVNNNNNNNNNNNEIPLNSSFEAAYHVELSDILKNAVTDVLNSRKALTSINNNIKDTNTTRDRMEAFNSWWRRTRKTDATKHFIAARSGNAYEDLIGFSCLLQQSSLTPGKGESVG